MSPAAPAPVPAPAGVETARPVESLGLRPRPTADPLVVALVATAAWEVWPRPAAPAVEDESARHVPWRFSGRWWARPLPVRRARPFGG